jgi:hypothetical protein
MICAIDPQLWIDPHFGQLSPAAKLMFLYLMAYDNQIISGELQLTTDGLATAIGLTPDATVTAWRECYPAFDAYVLARATSPEMVRKSWMVIDGGRKH